MATKEAEEKKRGKAKRPVGNTTDPDSRLQKTRTGFIQGYNAQVAVSADQVVVAAEVTPDPTDVAMLGPMLQSVRQNLSAARVEAPIEVGLADAGYWSQDNAELEIEGGGCLMVCVSGWVTTRWEDIDDQRGPGTRGASPPAG